jgi:hypothetical protein
MERVGGHAIYAQESKAGQEVGQPNVGLGGGSWKMTDGRGHGSEVKKAISYADFHYEGDTQHLLIKTRSTTSSMAALG